MTINEFLKELEKYGKGKFAARSGRIRYVERRNSYHAYNCICPIEYLCARLKHKSINSMYARVLKAADLLGLSACDRGYIIQAADKYNSEATRKIRPEMLKALGLKENEG